MASSGVVLGIDVGGTNTVLGFVDDEGRVVAATTMATEAQQPSEIFFERLHERIEELRRKMDPHRQCLGIGLGAPNANYYKGTIEEPPNLNWKYVDVVSTMKQWYDVPIALTNDANAAALGEQLFGAARGMKDIIVITLGTGVGSGIIANGSLVYGHDGFAGEIGHTVVVQNGRLCGCGRKGCLEAYASAGGMCLTAVELLAGSSEPSVLRKFHPKELKSKDIFDAASKGDDLALEVFDRAGSSLGMKLAEAVALLSPEAIILFGGVAEAGQFILRPVKKYLEENLLHIFRNKVRVLASGLPGAEAAILGASALIWTELRRSPVPE